MKQNGEKLLIKGGTVVDPANGTEEKRDILIEDGLIQAVDKPGAFANVADAQVIDASDKLVTPGLIDIHVHLREPGFEWRETILTGSQAAVAGGFTTVCCMPNTKPVNDHAQITDFILEQAKRANLCRVLPIGAITKGSNGEELAPMYELTKAGCVAFSDDGRPVMNAGIMRRALEYSLLFDTVLTVHEEDVNLSDGFVMNESALSIKLGLRGMPDAAENVMISRDIELALLTGARVHFCHVSTARGVTLIKRAKEDGIPVTAEVMPHNLVLDETAIGEYDTNCKMSMPLRTQKDIEALLEGLRTGVIDCISSDHAPHEPDSKNVEFDKASFGILGLQTTLPLTLGLVREGKLSRQRAIESLTTDAARCLKLNIPSLSKGKPADVTIIDEGLSILHTSEMIRSKSKNTPFLNKTLIGNASHTIVGGRVVYAYEEFLRSIQK